MATQDPVELLKAMDILFVPQNFIYVAGLGNNITAVELFLKAGMNVHTQHDGKTALYESCISGNEETVKLLLANGANANSPYIANSSGWIPLTRAIKQKNEAKGYPANIIKLLLENKADFEAKANGLNAMELAMSYKDNETIELLKKYGAKEPSKEEIEQLEQHKIKTQKDTKQAENKQIKSKLISYGIAAAIIIGLIIWAYSGSGGGSSSSSSSSGNYSSSEKTHTCVWCGKTYTGAGYYHIEDECASTVADYDQCCSQKCCMDQWNSTHTH